MLTSLIIVNPFTLLKLLMRPDATLEGGRCSDLLVDSLEDKQLISKINAYPPDDIHLVRT